MRCTFKNISLDNILSCLKKQKQNTHLNKYKEEIIENYSNYCYIFTDGSKGNKKPRCTVILNKKLQK